MGYPFESGGPAGGLFSARLLEQAIAADPITFRSLLLNGPPRARHTRERGITSGVNIGPRHDVVRQLSGWVTPVARANRRQRST
jgi:hypothetical protein